MTEAQKNLNSILTSYAINLRVVTLLAWNFLLYAAIEWDDWNQVGKIEDMFNVKISENQSKNISVKTEHLKFNDSILRLQIGSWISVTEQDRLYFFVITKSGLLCSSILSIRILKYQRYFSRFWFMCMSFLWRR